MNKEDIIGGVSPLKARQAHRGGKEAGAATVTAKQRGGYGKATGKRGAGGRNVAGYNVRTRFTPRADWQAPGTGGTPQPKSPDPKKPYSYTPTGEFVMDPFATKKWTEGETKTTTSEEEVLKESESGVAIGTWDKDAMGRLPTYDEAWDLNLENVRDKYKNKQDYKNKETARKEAGEEGATKEEIKKSIYETKTATKTETTPGHWTYYNENGEEISKAEYSKYKNKR